MKILPARSPTAREVVEALRLALSVGSPLRKVSGTFPILPTAGKSAQKRKTAKTRERNVHALERNYDGIIIGAGHHRLLLGGYIAKPGLDILVVERRLDYRGRLYPKGPSDPRLHSHPQP